MGGEIDLQCSDDSLLIFRKEEKKLWVQYSN